MTTWILHLCLLLATLSAVAVAHRCPAHTARYARPRLRPHFRPNLATTASTPTTETGVDITAFHSALVQQSWHALLDHHHRDAPNDKRHTPPLDVPEFGVRFSRAKYPGSFRVAGLVAFLMCGRRQRSRIFIVPSGPPKSGTSEGDSGRVRSFPCVSAERTVGPSADSRLVQTGPIVFPALQL